MTPTDPTGAHDGAGTNGSASGAVTGSHPVARRLAGLARDLERANRRVARLEELTGLMDTMLRQLAADVSLLAPAPDDEDEAPSPVQSWLVAEDPAQAAAQLADLVTWVGEVYLRYSGTTLPSCWLWHPAVVEELWWLRHAHHAAFHGRGACWRDVGDWHDRQRPGVTRRIDKALGDCELSRHVPGADRHQPTPVVPLADAAREVATAWAAGRGTPDPTVEQLDDAERHDRGHFRTRR